MKLKNTVSGVELELVGNDWTLIPAQAPERWVDVTGQCYQFENYLMRKHEDVLSHTLTQVSVAIHSDYRFRKLQMHERTNYPAQWAFVVEKRDDHGQET